MVSVNRPQNMPNGQMSNISNKVQNQWKAAACGTAIASVAIFFSLLYVGLRMSGVGNDTGPKEGVIECHDLKGNPIEEDWNKCEIQHLMFPTSNVYNFPYLPDSCNGVKKMPLDLTALADVLNTDFNYPSWYTYSYYPYSASTPTLDNYAATHVLVNSCHGCICLKLIPKFALQCKKPKVRRHAIILPRSVQPTCDVYEGDTVNVAVSKIGTDPSSVDIQIVSPPHSGQTATAGVDYQEIAPFNLDFIDFGDQEMFFTIDTYDDNVFEGVETFEVQLSNPSSGTIEYPILTITIIDND